MKAAGNILKAVYLPTLVALAVLVFASPAFAACMPTPQRMNDFLSNCYICDFVELLLGGINTVATQSFDMMGDVGGGPAISLMAIGFALWLGWHVGNYFVTYKYSDPMEFVTELGKCAFRVTFIFAILALPAAIAVDLIISPIVSMATELILGLVNMDVVADIMADNSLAGTDNFCALAVNESGLENGMAISPQVINSILCMVQAIYYEAVKGAVVGLGIQCYALGAVNLIIFSLPDIGMWIIGTAIYIVFMIITFTVAFSLVDFIVRIGFVLVMLPLLLVAWVFPITRNYTKKGWDLFLNSLVALIAIAIAMGLILKLLFSVLGNAEDIDACINEDRMFDLYHIVYTNGLDWILFIVVLFLCVLITKSSVNIAQHFVPISTGLAGSNIGAAVGGKMAAAAANLIKAAVTVASIVVTIATAGAGGVAIAGAKASAKVATTAAKKVAATAAKTASKAASKMGKFGQQAIKAGQKVQKGAQKAAEVTKKAADKAAKPIKAAAGKVKSGYKNIKQRVDNTKQGVSDKVAKVSRRMERGGRGSNNVLKLARVSRKAGKYVGKRVAQKVKDAPMNLVDKIAEKGKQTEQQYSGPDS